MSAIGWFTASWRTGLVFLVEWWKLEWSNVDTNDGYWHFLPFLWNSSKTEKGKFIRRHRPLVPKMRVSGVLLALCSLERCETAMVNFPHFLLWFVKQANSTDLPFFDDSTTLPLDHAAQYSFCVWKQWTSWSGCGRQWGKTLHQLQWSGSWRSSAYEKDMHSVRKLYEIVESVGLLWSCFFSLTLHTELVMRCSANCGPATRLRERSLGRFLIRRSFSFLRAVMAFFSMWNLWWRICKPLKLWTESVMLQVWWWTSHLTFSSR